MSQAPDHAQGGDPVADRLAKLQRLREELQIDPYGRRSDGLVPLAEARSRFDESAEGDDRATAAVAGRVMLHRDIGKLVFMTLRDATGDLQVAVSKKAVAPETFKLAKLADLGDVLVARGRVGTTKTGEITVWAEPIDEHPPIEMASKSLFPPPGKWSGLQDPELRYRRRYVDMYANPEVAETFAKRSRIVTAIRRFMEDRHFLEVETPMLQPIAGGAAARPFVTHHNALDLELYLRIAPELYLKRLLVGGLPRVYEINRNFRNEGIDRQHNPEFTMMEVYQAFSDYRGMMELTEELLHHLAVEHAGGETVTFGEQEISFKLPFRRAKYHDLFEEAAGFPASDQDKVQAKAAELNIETAGKDPHVLLNEVWEQWVEPTLVQPTFVIDYPAPLCPLTRRKADDPMIAERFELFIANMEIANAYTELNDPDIQQANFEAQIAGLDDEESTFRTMDHDFVDALRVGMPPAGGLGVGVDRVVMLLTGRRSIRDVILFPLLRPAEA